MVREGPQLLKKLLLNLGANYLSILSKNNHFLYTTNLLILSSFLYFLGFGWNFHAWWNFLGTHSTLKFVKCKYHHVSILYYLNIMVITTHSINNYSNFHVCLSFHVSENWVQFLQSYHKIYECSLTKLSEDFKCQPSI